MWTLIWFYPDMLIRSCVGELDSIQNVYYLLRTSRRDLKYRLLTSNGLEYSPTNETEWYQGPIK